MKKLIYNSVLLFLTGSVLLMSSCSKHDDQKGGSAVSSSEQRKIRDLIKRLPIEKMVYQRAMLNGKKGDHVTGAWTFGIPNAGIVFSNGSATGITLSNGPTTLYIASSSFGANTGGTVVAGATSLDINYTFCFASSDSDAMGLGLFDLGNGGFNGVSSVIGVSGDFEELGNANDSTSFGDIFKGLAFYIVYDGTAEGKYDVVDFSDIGDSTATKAKSFAFIMDFENGRIYLSKNGAINVSGGSMNFQGEYYEITGIYDDNGGVNYNGDISVVSGFGAMGCN